MMKLNIGMFFGGLFGALGILIFLLAFGSDYWLLATEVKKCSSDQADHEKAAVPATFHHEGFFWRCWFEGITGESTKTMWSFWFTNQSPSKNCTHAYLSPFPIDRENHNSSSSYESAVIYRGFWTIFMLLGIITIVAAGFLIVCAAPFAHQTLYKVGGIFFISAGILFSMVVVMYVIWIQAVADLENYINSHKTYCPHFTVYVRYGWSFILASIGIFFSLIAGMLFLLVGRTIQIHTS